MTIMYQTMMAMVAVALTSAGLRSPEEQLWLSRLAQAPAVHLIASIDHTNAALLWDNRIAAAFKWLWVEATSYASYGAETSNVIPILTSKSSRDVCWMLSCCQPLLLPGACCIGGTFSRPKQEPCAAHI